MRSVPDWSIQLAWWVAGIFATGAGWYFLSTNNAPLAFGSAIAAGVFAVVAILLHRKKDALAAALLPDELKNKLPGDYVRRTSDNDADVRLVRYLPEMKAVVRESSSSGWDSGVTLEMRAASFDMVDFLEFAWLRLAEFYPRNHFNAPSARDYIESYVRDRFAFHRAKHEPQGPGSGGAIAGVLTDGDVIGDLNVQIEDTVRTLFFDNELLDLEDWLSRWRSADDSEATNSTVEGPATPAISG